MGLALIFGHYTGQFRLQFQMMMTLRCSNYMTWQNSKSKLYRDFLVKHVKTR